MPTPTRRSLALNPAQTAGLAFGALVLLGTLGYRGIEGMSLVDALYMTVITVSTVGFGEVQPLSPAGRLFTIGIIAGGVVVGTYSVTQLAGYVFSGEWQAQLRERRRMERIRHLANHMILCGYGRVGRHVAEELRSEGIDFVVLETDVAAVRRAEEAGLTVLHADAAHEASLRQARIEHARGLIATASNDAENVFIVLTAHTLQPQLQIVARADSEESEPKLRRAGASRVILPYHLTGRRMVSMLTRPAVAEFLDEVTHTSGLEFLVEQIPIRPGSPLAGLRLEEARRDRGFELTVLAVRHPDGRFQTHVTGSQLLEAGSVLIAVGTVSQIRAVLAD